jgi:hypothetical protein
VFCNALNSFYKELSALGLTHKLEDQLLTFIHDYLFVMFQANIPIWGPYPPCATHSMLLGLNKHKFAYFFTNIVMLVVLLSELLFTEIYVAGGCMNPRSVILFLGAFALL